MRTMERLKTRPGRLRVAWIYLVCCAATGIALAQRNAPVLPDPGNPPMTRGQQETLGLQTAQEVYRQMPVLPDSSPLTRYVQEIGNRLVKTIPPEHSWPFQFHVIEQKEINAFALPGGPMFVNVGTIRSAKNEAELAGVMAHEMSHVYMQHSAKQQQKSSLLGGLSGIAGAIAGAFGGGWGTLARTGIQFGAGTLMLKYSRADESQADAVGAIILWKADYNPIALADFFEMLEKQGSSGGPQFLSDHPNPGNRRQAIEREIAEWPLKQYRSDNVTFETARKEAESAPAFTVDEISAGAKSGRWAAQNRKSGAVFPDAAAAAVSMPAAPFSAVQPSANFQQTSLGAITIERPENWEVIPGRQSDAATIAPRAGVSGSSVAYGVVIQVFRPQDASLTVQKLTQEVAQSLENSDSNMQQTGSIDEIRVNGAVAGSVKLRTISPMSGADKKPQPEQDWLIVIPRSDGSAIGIIFVSPQSYFQQTEQTFVRMLRSVTF